MSYSIAASGSLLRTPELRTSEKGVSYGWPTSIVNSHNRADDGTWKDLGSARYSPTIFCSAAENLIDAANHGGDLRVLFTGQATTATTPATTAPPAPGRDVLVDAASGRT